MSENLRLDVLKLKREYGLTLDDVMDRNSMTINFALIPADCLRLDVEEAADDIGYEELELDERIIVARMFKR